MGTVILPAKPLSLPDNTLAGSINVPRSHKVFDTHINVTKNVHTEVLAINEVSLVNGAIFIIHNRDSLVSDTTPSQVHHTFTLAKIAEINNNLVTNSSTIQTVDVTTDKNKIGLITLHCQVHKYVIECFFNVRLIESSIEVIRRSTPPSLSSTVLSTNRTSGRI